MLRYVRCRLTHRDQEGCVEPDTQQGWDWRGMARSLARYAYSTSENRHRASPSIV